MSGSSDARLYPLFLKLGGRRVLVVGAGAVAERKINSLLEAQARVCVVAPEATAEVARLARASAVEWRIRPFEEADADGAWLVIAATADPRVQQDVAAAAAKRRAFCVAIDDPANASAYSAAVVRREPFTIAISSSGATPALTRLVREVIEHVLPREEWIEHAKQLRAKWIAEQTPVGERFGDLVKELAEKAR